MPSSKGNGWLTRHIHNSFKESRTTPTQKSHHSFGYFSLPSKLSKALPSLHPHQAKNTKADLLPHPQGDGQSLYAAQFCSIPPIARSVILEQFQNCQSTYRDKQKKIPFIDQTSNCIIWKLLLSYRTIVAQSCKCRSKPPRSVKLLGSCVLLGMYLLTLVYTGDTWQSLAVFEIMHTCIRKRSSTSVRQPKGSHSPVQTAARLLLKRSIFPTASLNPKLMVSFTAYSNTSITSTESFFF